MITEATKPDTRPTWARSWKTERRDLATAHARIVELEAELATARANGNGKPKRRAKPKTNGHAPSNVFLGRPYPACPCPKPSVSARGVPKPHPGCTRWNRLYKTVAGWIQAHPGEMAGRMLTPPPVVYYFVRPRRNGCICFCWNTTGAPEGETELTEQQWKAARAACTG
jgi:hypothetical protein